MNQPEGTYKATILNNTIQYNLAKADPSPGLAKCFFSSLECSYFCELGAHAKNQNPTTPPYASLATVVRKKNTWLSQDWGQP